MDGGVYPAVRGHRMLARKVNPPLWLGQNLLVLPHLECCGHGSAQWHVMLVTSENLVGMEEGARAHGEWVERPMLHHTLQELRADEPGQVFEVLSNVKLTRHYRHAAKKLIPKRGSSQRKFLRSGISSTFDSN